MKLIFAPIDAKDFNGSYDVISFEDTCRPRSKNNTKLLYQATTEYLQRIDALQKDIVAKFESQFEDDSHIDPGEAFCMTKCICDERPCEANKKYNHLYYT